MSQFPPSRPDSRPAFRTEDEKAVDDLTKDDLTKSDPASETASNASGVPRHEPPAPVAPVEHDATAADVRQDERPEWAQSPEEAPSPVSASAPVFDYDLHGRLEEAFGASDKDTVPTSAFDAVVERDLAQEPEAETAPKPVAAPEAARVSAFRPMRERFEPETPAPDPAAPSPEFSSRPEQASSESAFAPVAQPAAQPPVEPPAQPSVEARVFGRPDYSTPPVAPPIATRPDDVVEPARYAADTDLNSEIALELERALDDDLPSDSSAAAFATVEREISAPRPIVSPHRAAPEPARLPEPVPAQEEPGDPFAQELEKLLAASAGSGAGAGAADGPEPADPPQFQPTALDGDALFAADADRGAPVGNEPAEDDTAFLATLAEGNEGKSRTRTVALAVLGVALLGGFGAFALNMFETDSGETPIIIAGSEPIKVRPDETGGEEVPNQDQTVYREVEGTAEEPDPQARLEEDTEEPIKVATTSPGDNQETLLRPRSVRTVTVRPDGTIVARGGADAADETPPAGTPVAAVNAPTLTVTPAPVAPRINAGAGDNSNVVIGSPVFTTPEPAATEPSTTETRSPVTGATPETVAAPAVEPRAEPVQVAGTRPTPRPLRAPVDVISPEPAPVAAPVAVATPAPVAAPTVESQQVAERPPFAVQISSQRSEAAAQQTYQTLARQYPSALDGRGVDIRRAEIEGKGVFYRVRIPAQTRSEAITVCETLKASGGSCFVTR